MAGATPARRAAFQILEEVRRGRTFDQAREGAMADLSQRDRRLAHELAAGVLRNRRNLDAGLAPLVPRGLRSVDPPLLQVLRLGAYQLHKLTRVPAHAAVNASVEMARQVAGARGARFVNAVLRHLATQPMAVPTPPGPTASLAQRYSHPEWLVARWLARFGREETEALLAWNNRVPPLVVQPAREDLTTLALRWQGAGVRFHPARYRMGLVVEDHDVGRLPGYDAGAFVVQDPAQALVVRFASIPPGARVYDACAAPGGKAITIGRDARIVLASDLHRTRVMLLARNLRRAGSGREHALLADARHPPIRAVDAVLLDAPCTGTGTFARHPEARWRLRRGALERLAARQATLLERLAAGLRPGGLLIYATCSLEPEENVEQVERFLRAQPGFRREPSPAIPPELVSPDGDLLILPQRHGMDGAFATRLRRAA